MKIPKGKLAAAMQDNDALKRKREELRDKLLKGKNVRIGQNGNIGDDSADSIKIPKGKLAMPGQDNDALKRKREELRKKLLEGKKVGIGTDGKVDDGNSNSIQIPKGKLAGFYWYEDDPELLAAEKAAMKRFFPGFKLEKMDDGRYYWIGSIKTGLLGDNEWNLQVVYDNDYPKATMGGSVKVYTIDPDITEMSRDLGWRPHHLLRDDSGYDYLCTTEAGFIKTGKVVTSAATTLSWAVKWISVFELVLGGEVSQKEFDKRTF